jgi:hypothetical protein
LGTVQDTTGAVLPGVEITITNVDTAQARLAISGDEGRYSAPQLGIGNYEIRAELAGFQTGVRRGIQLAVGQQAVVNFTMQIGSITEEVVVSGEAPLVNTTSSTLSDVITEVQVHDLPLNSRNLSQLSLLTPGVTRIYTAITGGVTQGASSVRVSVAGARTYMTGYLLDGTDVTEVSRGMSPGGAAGSLFGVETIKEFRIVTNNFSAEYGRFAGGVMSMVTKSGTNAFHGSVFEFHRNDNLDATNFFTHSFGQEKPEFKRNQFGATIGGPVVKDKTFFFFSYEGFREGMGRSFAAVVPTVEAKQGIWPLDNDGECTSVASFGGTKDPVLGRCIIPVNPDAQPFIDLYPDPNGAATRSDGITGDLFTTKTEPTDEDFFTGRVDHSLSDSDSFFGRYTTTFGTKASQFSLPFTATTQDSSSHYVTLEEKHIFSPTTLNTARIGFQRTRFEQTMDPANAGPLDISLRAGEKMGRIWPEGGIEGLGLGVEGQSITNAFYYSDDVFLTRGRHDLKLGGQLAFYQTNDFTLGDAGGRYQFGGLAPFITGTPRQWNGHTPESFALRGSRQKVIGLYIQDDFKWSPNLTVNLGVRYEAITTPTEVNGLLSNLRDPINDAEPFIGDPYFKNPSKKNFGPRIGFAWDPSGDGKTSIRSGFGVFHDTILPYHYANQIRRAPPFAVTINVRNPTFPTPTQGPVSSQLQFLTPEFEPAQPYMMQWNLTLQRELFSGTTLTAAYVGSKGTNLQAERFTNVAVPEVLPDGRKLFRSGLPRRNPNYGRIRYWEFSQDSNYSGLQLGLRKRFAEGLQFQASYTFGRSLDTVSRANFSDIQDNRSKYPQDPYDFNGSNYGTSDHDVRHSFSFNYVYELPIRGFSGAAKYLLEGWQINGIVSLSTGNPLQAILGGLGDWDRDRNTNSNAHRPSLRPGANNNPVRADGRDPEQYFDPNAFVLQDPGFYGDVGRNTLIGPGVSTFDFSVFKNTALTEEVTLQFRAEFFNLFNRANFGKPNDNVFSAATRESVPCSFHGSTGDPSGCDRVALDSQGNPLVTYDSSFARITQTRTTNRQIQLGLRLTF